MLDYETRGCNQYGAFLGRGSSLSNETFDKLRLVRVRLDTGGYDKGGAYWGISLPLYMAEDTDGNVRYLRAASRQEAKDSFPYARFRH